MRPVNQATVMRDVAQWLEQLGLGKYAEAFTENDIGSDVLPHLTEEHFKELGVSLGDRLRLLKAIEAVEAAVAAVPCSPSALMGQIEVIG